MPSWASSYLSRHYHLTVIALAVSVVALWKGLINGGQWVAIASCALTQFRVGDVFDTWVKGRQNPKP